MSKHSCYLIATVCVALLAVPAFAEPQAVKGEISNVTVYHGQALVTRTLELELGKGSAEVIVDELPNHILPDSIYAQADGTKVVSVRFRNQPVEEDTREEVRQLEEKIEGVKRELELAKRHSLIGKDMNVFYKGLWGLSVDGTDADLEQGLLKAGEISKLTEYLEARYVDWHERETETIFRIEDLTKELELLNRERAELNAGSSKTKRQAVLYLLSPEATKATVTVNYLVNGANWTPSYNLRAVPDEAKTRIEYNAVVNQTSGEDWNDVAIELSTAQPTMTATPPKLQPMEIGLTTQRPQQSMTAQQRQIPGISFDMPAITNYAKIRQTRNSVSKGGIEAQKQLEQLAAGNQMVEFNMSAKDVMQLKEDIAKAPQIEGISVTYKLDGRMTLPSRSDQQIVTIASADVPADFTLVATPLLTDYVYLQAELTNDSDIIFLPGQASIFRDGEFAGTGNMPLVTVGEKFTTGFGADSQVQAVRTLEDKQTRVQGGNQIDTYTYSITVSNFKDAKTELRLLDRLPYTEDKSIRIELSNAEPKLSKDKHEKGILTWDLQLPANSTGDDATKVKYTYTMEYDKSMQIVNK